MLVQFEGIRADCDVVAAPFIAKEALDTEGGIVKARGGLAESQVAGAGVAGPRADRAEGRIADAGITVHDCCDIIAETAGPLANERVTHDAAA